MNTDIVVKVHFSQDGTWGTTEFAGELFCEKCPGTELFGKDEYYIALRITEGPEQYIGLELEPGEIMPGLFATGYDHPLSGKCFIGNIKVGNTAKELRNFDLPAKIFAMEPNYLNIDKNTELSSDQKALLLESVRYDKEQRFNAGNSIREIFTKEELEGSKAGEVFYA
jgi:hypothetical protein